MGKRKYQQRKPPSTPKGLPYPKNSKKTRLSHHNHYSNTNPFESARASSAKQPKFQVHNRPISGRVNALNKGPATALQRSINNRRNALKSTLENNKKAGSFVDRRIGESRKAEMTEEERMLARLVRERTRRSKKLDKFSLEDDGKGLSLTHRGNVIDESYASKFEADAIILSDDDGDENYGGQLERADTEMHFGGGSFDRKRAVMKNPYGPAGGIEGETLGDRYRSRKEELDEMIMRKKWQKAEKAKEKEDQVEKFEGMDDQFKALSSLLQFRDKAEDRAKRMEEKKAGTLSTEDKEMEDWEKEMKEYMFERRCKATDRTKTPEEIAKEKSDKLHDLEKRRLARMHGEVDSDMSNLSDDENRPKKKAEIKTVKNPDELDSDEEEEDFETRFTADGLVYTDKGGKVIKKVELQKVESLSAHSKDSGSNDDVSIGGSDEEASASDDDGDDNSLSVTSNSSTTLDIGTRIKGKYRAEEQFEGKGRWYAGIVTKAYKDSESGDILYDVEYDDGDIETDMKQQNIKQLKRQNKENGENEVMKPKTTPKPKKKKVMNEIPYVFEVPTTLDGLHDLIAAHATTGLDACLIIQRIHTANSVRINRKNSEKMQNFYDVLLRRFICIGDALYKFGNGGKELERYEQLNALTRSLYGMAQESADTIGAVWGRRIGIFQNALAKRIRDAGYIEVDEDQKKSAWPSPGCLLLMRAVGHIFPVTDTRHVVVTPTLLLLGQILAQSPVMSLEDVTKGLFCAGLMIEFTREATRIPPEAFSFIASTLNLFSEDPVAAFDDSPIPTFSVKTELDTVRQTAINYCSQKKTDDCKKLSLLFEKRALKSKATPAILLLSSLRLVERCIEFYKVSMASASEIEVFDQITRSLLRLDPNNTLPKSLSKAIRHTTRVMHLWTQSGESRIPLSRRSSMKRIELSVQSLAPRIEDPTKYSLSKDRGKTNAQAQYDKLRRESRREHKAISRELRLDAVFIENERRREKNFKDDKAREKRHKNFAWLEQEQAIINQQVAKGGELLKGGGIGSAKKKMGMKG